MAAKAKATGSLDVGMIPHPMKWLLAEIVPRGVSQRTVYRWVERGQIPHLKIGSRFYFQPAKVAEWFEGGCGGRAA